MLFIPVKRVILPSVPADIGKPVILPHVFTFIEAAGIDMLLLPTIFHNHLLWGTPVFCNIGFRLNDSPDTLG